MRIALAQLDATVADFAGNLDKLEAAAARAKAAGADLVVFPEQCLGGYPALDLWEEPAFVRASAAALARLSRRLKRGPAAIVGCALESRSRVGKPVANAAALIAGGKVVARRDKTLLPTYDVFDEARYFEPAADNRPILFKGCRLGLTICEDAWAGESRLYARDPVRELAKAGARLIVNISASPFWRGKNGQRVRLLSRHARTYKVPLLYCNLVGGNDETIFDGKSLVLDARGRVVAKGKAFAEDLVLVDTERLPKPLASPLFADDAEETIEALTLGLRDYARKCGFKTAVVGLSGGIDSAVVGALAARALGAENVTGVSMPSEFSSPGSKDDAAALARNLGLRYLTIPIQDVFESYKRTLASAFSQRSDEAGRQAAEQNLQARVRGAILMSLSNKEGSLLVSTGNKSELSVGYCTLYGDMCGGLAVLADVPKRVVYEIARRLNETKAVIPQSSIDKPPSAELRPDQTDQDDLPPYDVVDDVLEAYVERRAVPPGPVAAELMRRIDRAEYKRRQAPPSLKISPKAFGVGRRMPIARASYVSWRTPAEALKGPRRS